MRDPSIEFLEEAARYFEMRDTRGEDSAHWSNVANAENCRKAAALIAALQSKIDALDQERNGFAQLCALRTAERDAARSKAEGPPNLADAPQESPTPSVG